MKFLRGVEGIFYWPLIIGFAVGTAVGAVAGISGWKAYGWLSTHVSVRWEQIP